MIVEDLLKQKNIQYLPSGRDFLVRCLSPDHDDKNPSMRIDKTTGVFNCLSCGYKGNLFNLFEEQPNWLQIRRNKLKDVIEHKLKETVGLEIPENAVKYCWDWRGISASTYEKFEAFEHNDFAGRLVFPIRNISGKIAAFCGRLMVDGTQRYKFYPAKVSIPLFPTVKPIKDSVVLVEGLFDMLNLHDKGLSNTICLFGVNTLTNDKINILKMQGINTVYLMLDNDTAGIEASEKIKLMLDNAELNSISVTYEGKDPGELTAQQVLSIKEELYNE